MGLKTAIKCFFGKHVWSNVYRTQKLEDHGGICINCTKTSNEVLGKLMNVTGF